MRIVSFTCNLSLTLSCARITGESKVVYRINCLDCEEFYVGMTERILQKRISEHEKLETSSVYIHSKLTNHNIDFASPVILAHDNVKLRIQVKETILIKEHTAYNSLNRNTGSFHLTLW